MIVLAKAGTQMGSGPKRQHVGHSPSKDYQYQLGLKHNLQLELYKVNIQLLISLCATNDFSFFPSIFNFKNSKFKRPALTLISHLFEFEFQKLNKYINLLEKYSIFDKNNSRIQLTNLFDQFPIHNKSSSHVNIVNMSGTLFVSLLNTITVIQKVFKISVTLQLLLRLNI